MNQTVGAMAESQASSWSYIACDTRGAGSPTARVRGQRRDHAAHRAEPARLSPAELWNFTAPQTHSAGPRRSLSHVIPEPASQTPVPVPADGVDGAAPNAGQPAVLTGDSSWRNHRRGLKA